MPAHFLSAIAPGRCCLTIERTGEILASDTTIARDSESRKRGLLGRDALRHDQALVIAPTQGVHTFGMRFAIDIVAVDRQGRVVKIRSNVRRSRIVLAFSAFAFIEMHAGALDHSNVQVGDRVLASTPKIRS